jgi:enoyl-[acyl-carrier-protein] reductase (NADH)
MAERFLAMMVMKRLIFVNAADALPYRWLSSSGVGHVRGMAANNG